MVGSRKAVHTAQTFQAAFHKNMVQRTLGFPARIGRRIGRKPLITVIGEQAELFCIRRTVEIAHQAHIAIRIQQAADVAYLAELVRRTQTQVHIGDDNAAAAVSTRAASIPRPLIREGSGSSATHSSGKRLKIRLPCNDSLPTLRLVWCSE